MFSGLRSRWMTPLRVGEGDGVADFLEDGEQRGERILLHRRRRRLRASSSSTFLSVMPRTNFIV